MVEEKKSLFLSKTVWGGFIVIASALAKVLGAQYGLDLSIFPELLISVGSMLGVIGLRDAIRKIEK